MPRFFVGQEAIAADTVTLTGENARHLSLSLRARVGDVVTVCDRQGTVYTCKVQSMDGKSAVCAVLSCEAADTEPPYEAVLCQAIPKGDKMDLIVQKAVELGVSRILPFESENCVARVRADARDRKTARWRKIAEQAAGQCGRGRVPTVEFPVAFEEMLTALPTGKRLLCYERGGAPLAAALSGVEPGQRVSVMIGPEGGFAAQEAERAMGAGWEPVTLGKRILRCETAPLYVLGALSFLFEK